MSAGSPTREDRTHVDGDAPPGTTSQSPDQQQVPDSTQPGGSGAWLHRPGDGADQRAAVSAADVPPANEAAQEVQRGDHSAQETDPCSPQSDLGRPQSSSSAAAAPTSRPVAGPRASSIPPSSSTGSIFRATQQQPPSSQAPASLGKAHPQSILQQARTLGIPVPGSRTPSSASIRAAPSPTTSPTRLRTSSRSAAPPSLTAHRSASARMPSSSRPRQGSSAVAGEAGNQAETESVVSGDGEYYDDEAGAYSELEATGPGEEGGQRGRPKTFQQRATDTVPVGSAPSDGRARGQTVSVGPSVGSVTVSRGRAPTATSSTTAPKKGGEGTLKGKGKAPGSTRRPPLSRSRSRAARRESSDSSDDDGVPDPAPMLGGAAAMASSSVSSTGGGGGGLKDTEDDEVERVDRGEELVRRRMKERQRLKKEAEKAARRAEEQERSRQHQQQQRPVSVATSQPATQGMSPVMGAGRPVPPSSARFTGRTSILPPPQLSLGIGGRSAPSETGVSSASASWERPPPQIDWRSSRASAVERRTSAAGSFIAGTIGEGDDDDDGATEDGGTGGEGMPSRVGSFVSYRDQREEEGAGTGGQTPTAMSPRMSRSDSTDLAIPKSPALGGGGGGRRLASRGLRAVSYASSMRGGAEAGGGLGFAPEEREPVVEEPEEEGVREESGREVGGDEEDREEDREEGEGEGREMPEGEEVDSSSDPGDEDVEYTLKDRQDAINIEHPFGLPIWKPALYKKSRSATRNAEAALHNVPKATTESNLKLGNLIWTFSFGTWLALALALLSVLLFVMPWGGSKYGRVVWELATYLFWPFGKYVEAWSEDDDAEESAETEERDGEGGDGTGHGRVSPFGQRWEAFSDIGDDDIEAAGRTWSHAAIRLAGSYGSTEEDVDRGYRIGGDERSSLLSPARTETGTIRRSPSRPLHPANVEVKDRYPSGSSSGETAMPASRARSRSPTKSAMTASQQGFVDGVHGHDGKPPIRVRALGRLSYWAAYYLVIAPLMLIACIVCWFFVFTIPMAKLLWVLVCHLGSEPLALHFRDPPTFVPVAPPHQNGEALENALDGAAGVAPRLKPGQPAPKHSKKSLSASRAKGRLVSGRAKVLLCTYQALGLQYYKYTVDGVNIIFIILMPFVIFVIFDAFFLEPLHLGGFGGFLASQGVIFVMALLSVIPLSYFIGMAVASISAQSSIGMGAVINATFGSIIEILLYSIALTKGKGELVEGSIIGSMLAGVLLMPGLSMIGGAVRRKEQKFNARSAGVTSTMLIMAIIGTLTPTLFYEIYGTFQLSCTDCPAEGPSDALRCRSCRYEHVDPADDPFYQQSVRGLSFYCAILLVFSYLIGLWFSLRTHASQIWQTPAHLPDIPHAAIPAHPEQDAMTNQRVSAYVKKLPELLKQHRPAPAAPDSTVRPGSAAYPSTPAQEASMTAEELRRTLRVLEIVSQHQPASSQSLKRQPSQISNAGAYHGRDASRTAPPAAAEGGHGGHEAPTWSRSKSTTVLLSCTVLYAIIAEILVEVVDVVLDGSGIPEKFLGITLFALVPNTTEFMNAISFAINGNIALSMEIGSAYTLQVCLIQIPIMILFSAIYNAGQAMTAHHAFTLVFPRWDIIAIIFSVFLLTYTYIEARANYYRGTILVLSYLVLMGGFYAAPAGLDTEDDPILMNTFAVDSLRPIRMSIGRQLSTFINSTWR